jgi:hypothetical protein
MEVMQTPLEIRIRQIRAEIDGMIDARAEAVARQSPGVPLEVIRNLLTARTGLPLRAISRIDGRGSPRRAGAAAERPMRRLSWHFSRRSTQRQSGRGLELDDRLR